MKPKVFFCTKMKRSSICYNSLLCLYTILTECRLVFIPILTTQWQLTNLVKVKKKYLALVFVVTMILILSYKIANRNVGETCSPVGDDLVCSRFKCQTGSPQATFGGSGSCSDNSKPTIIKTWTQWIKPLVGKLHFGIVLGLCHNKELFPLCKQI